MASQTRSPTNRPRIPPKLGGNLASGGGPHFHHVRERFQVGDSATPCKRDVAISRCLMRPPACSPAGGAETLCQLAQERCGAAAVLHRAHFRCEETARRAQRRQLYSHSEVPSVVPRRRGGILRRAAGPRLRALPEIRIRRCVRASSPSVARASRPERSTHP